MVPVKLTADSAWDIEYQTNTYLRNNPVMVVPGAAMRNLRPTENVVPIGVTLPQFSMYTPESVLPSGGCGTLPSFSRFA